MDFTSLKKNLAMNSKGQAGIMNMIIMGGVAAVVTIFMIGIYKKVNSTQTINEPTMDMVPSILALLLIVGLLAGAAYFFARR